MVGLSDETVDGGLEVDDRVKDAALEAALAEFGEETLDGVEPGAGSRGEVEDERGWRASQALTFGCLWVA